MKQGITYIHAKPPGDEYAKHWYRGAGFYFSDECEFLNGPYDTKEAAETARDEYAKTI
jgi:hypothetical protein